MKKRESLYFKKLLILGMVMALVVSFVFAATYAVQEAKNATPTGPHLLPPGSSKIVERHATATGPIHNPAGSQMFVAGLTIVPTCDGYIDATEWSDANMYDISDTTGQSDDVPDPLGSVILWLKQDDNGIYFAIRNNTDMTLQEWDQIGLYFDDNYDGCFPASATNEGNNWLIYGATGPYVQWRYIQDFDCGFPPAYDCAADNFAGDMVWAPTCYGIGIGPTGVVDYEVMIPYGTLDEYLDLNMPPDSLGFFVYCTDIASFEDQGVWPSQGHLDTWKEPCYYGRLICETGEEWPNHKMHFPQLPDLEGWDVNATDPKTLADDWQCSRTGPVEDIHFWGSWKDLDGDPTTDDFFTPMPFFRLSIHRNIPASPDTPWSRPGELLWFWEGEIQGVPSEPPSLEGWIDPNTGEVLYNDHIPYWRYDFFFEQAYPAPEPFYQFEDTIYWLDVSALFIQPPYQWGWKNSRDHFMDDAAYTDNHPTGPWYPIVEPPRYNEFTVEFGYLGEPTFWDGTNYYGEGFYEYEYWWNMWFYDNPFTWDQPKIGWIDFSVTPNVGTPWIEFAINWSSPEWDTMGMGRPPLPGVEEMYVERQIFGSLDPDGEYAFPIDIPYNPEWISVDFVANDVVISGHTYHECVGTSLDLAFVITGPECTPSVDAFKFVWDETQQLWIELVDLNVGETAEFLVQIHNDGTCCDLTNIDVYDFMDESLEFLSADPTPASVQPVPGGTELTWSFPGPLSPDNWINITIDARVLGPVCHTDSNFVFIEAYCEASDEFVTDEDVAYVHATEPPWPDHKMHYPQLPDPEGWDVVATMGYDTHPGIVTADDFMCTESGRITDIHLWGSWLYDVDMPIQGFFLSIHDNIPGPPSMPGAELWSAYVTDFEVVPEAPGLQGWYDPFAPWWEYPNHEMYFRYDITNIPEPFCQDSGTIYWLNVMADIGPPGYLGVPFPEPPLWGWKTSLEHYEDDAVWAIWTPPAFAWEPLTDPITGMTLDLAFVITAEDVLCGDVNNNGAVEAGDVVFLISYLFRGGPAPCPLLQGDVNCSGAVEAGDVVYLIGYLFRGGPDPCDPDGDGIPDC
jgi:hypothetical protein